ncbi:MAG TPA: response regulator transcription factor, partial [Chitinophagaceae bacterium]|nr:response regulator transcription factor [Chitinophagaceae bacterium]
MKSHTGIPIRIIIADDHEVFREGFQSMLKKYKEIELVGEAENGNELIRLAESLHPDVIVTDIKMPKMDGIEATRILAESHPHIHVIALSMFDDDDLIIDMLEAGAKGYLLKNAHKEDIVEAIKTVYNDEPYYCNNTTHKLAQLIAKSKFNPSRKKIRPQFTPKEIEVIRLICQGFSNKEMAAHLSLSIRTIEGHREKIHEKT